MIPLWKGWWQNMDDEPVELKEALEQMKAEGQIPDGFLYRLIVVEGSDLQPFSTSIYGLTVSHSMELNRSSFEKEEKTFQVFDLVGFTDFDNMGKMMEDTDTLMGQIIKQSLDEGFITNVSLAVHFINRPDEDLF